MQPALSGPIARIPDVDIDDLKRKNLALQRSIDDLELELQKQKNEAKRATQALTNLRDILQPLHRAMRMVFGEIETVDLPGARTTTAMPSTGSAGVPSKWDAIKARLGGRQSLFITILQEMGDANTSQLAAAAKCDPRTVNGTIFLLTKGGFISKNNGRFSLKE